MSICLVIVFNHKYEKNIKQLKMMYEKRFSNIYFLMPFYKGVDKRVIPVYENSYQFQGYFAQGISKFYNDKFDYYVFIGDDLILSPFIDEDNIVEKLKIDNETSYIQSFEPLSGFTDWKYTRIKDILSSFIYKGTNFWNEIPEAEQAFAIAKKYGFTDFKIKNFCCFGINSIKKAIKSKNISKLFYYNFPYPMMAGYSDFIVIDRYSIKQFCELCGVFAAMRVFVESAIPTAMMLSCKKINTNINIDLVECPMWSKEEVRKIESSYSCDINNLLENWPSNVLYYHPIKLSKWTKET